MISLRVLAHVIGLLGTATLGSAVPAGALQPKEPLVLFPVAFYGKGANSLEPGDSLVAVMTDSILRGDLEQSGRFELVDRSRVVQALADAEKGGKECVTLDCRRELSRKLGATWMVTAKLSKTSNLIWYLSGQLTDAATGRRLLDDEVELKGIAEDIAKATIGHLTDKTVFTAFAQFMGTPARSDLPARSNSALDFGRLSAKSFCSRCMSELRRLRSMYLDGSQSNSLREDQAINQTEQIGKLFAQIHRTLTEPRTEPRD